MFVRPLVGPSVREHKSKSVKTRISAPAHLSATGGRVSGLVTIGTKKEIKRASDLLSSADGRWHYSAKSPK